MKVGDIIKEPDGQLWWVGDHDTRGWTNLIAMVDMRNSENPRRVLVMRTNPANPVYKWPVIGSAMRSKVVGK